MLDLDIAKAKKIFNEKNDVIFVAGHNGLVGSAVVRQLKKMVLKT